MLNRLTMVNKHERFLELAAVSIAERLSTSEEAELRDHLASCSDCRRVSEEYRELAQTAAAAKFDTQQSEDVVEEWNHQEQKGRLFVAANAVRNAGSSAAERSNGRQAVWRLLTQPAFVSAAAAIIVVSVFAGYLIGFERTASVSQIASSPVPVDNTATINNKDALQAQQEIELAKQEALRAGDRIRSADAEIARLTSDKTVLLFRVKALESQTAQQSLASEAIQSERESLNQQLKQIQDKLRNVEQDLSNLQDERRQQLKLVAATDFKIEQMSADLAEKDRVIAQQQQFLQADRDIRELMGARQLYIADVVDVDRDGRNRKAFGRLFYTKGKSLVFYAFDLDQQPGIKNASVFQVWGQSEADAHRSVSLGIFYLDNETNHRWVLRADNPDLLSQIDSVFVTAEAHGISKRPSGKPFLFTYLRRSLPNHP